MNYLYIKRTSIDIEPCLKTNSIRTQLTIPLPSLFFGIPWFRASAATTTPLLTGWASLTHVRKGHGMWWVCFLLACFLSVKSSRPNVIIVVERWPGDAQRESVLFWMCKFWRSIHSCRPFFYLRLSHCARPQPEYGDEQADAGRDRRTRLAKLNYQARTGTGEFHFPCSADHGQSCYPVDPYLPPVLSTCPLRTNSGCGKERRILIVP